MTRTPAKGMNASGQPKSRDAPKRLLCCPRTCPLLMPRSRPYSPVFEAVRAEIASAQIPRFRPFWGQKQQVGSDPQKGWKRASLASFTAREGHFRAVKPMARVRAEPSENRALDLFSLAAAHPANRPWKGRSAAHYVSRPEMHELRTIAWQPTSNEISGFCPAFVPLRRCI